VNVQPWTCEFPLTPSTLWERRHLAGIGLPERFKFAGKMPALQRWREIKNWALRIRHSSLSIQELTDRVRTFAAWIDEGLDVLRNQAKLPINNFQCPILNDRARHKPRRLGREGQGP
jgi:hypothetical protein